MQFRKLGLWALVLIFASLAASPAAAQSVIITEFLADNSGGLLDEDGDSPDWIELYNTASTTVNLNGWYLTDETNNLTKWSFPATNLAPAGFMIVFASGKNRRVPGAPLHTDFSLDTGGEYLALVQPDGVTIASEFNFPPQRANFSYGVAQTVQVTRLITNTQSVKVFVPNGGASLPANWATNDFNDSSWLSGLNGVGYETSIPGFAVRNFKSSVTVDSLAKAEGVVTNVTQQSAVYSENVATINYLNTGTGAHYGSDRTFPGFTINVDIEDFVLEAFATITIPAPGNWTFGVNSDDGFRLTIGSTTMEYDPPRGPADTLQTFSFPTAGDYPLRLLFYERGGGSEVELFAIQGSSAAWSSSYRLVGDVAGGGLQVRSTPVSGGGGLGYRSLIRTDIQAQMLSNNASAFVRMPFNVNNAASFTSLTLQMRYDDGFVAYLNGIEVARRQAPAVLTETSAATGAHLGVNYENINLSENVSLLREGANLLAIQGLNVSANDTDFFIMAEMAQNQPTQFTNTYFSTPTPAAFNTGSGFAGFVADTKFSHDRGFYETNFMVTITTDTPGATIRYTTNGSAVTATSGYIYTGPLPINGTTTLRAAAFKTGLVPSDVDTQTYIFVNDVIRQSPNGARPTAEWPAAGSVNGQIIDYGMDPEIVTNANWSPLIKDALKSIPSFSIVTDLGNLFDLTTGIYVHPSGDEKTWERPASVELIYPDGREGFQINAGLRIRGGFSRDPSNPKHAFRFFFRQEYGASKLHYPVFGPNGAEEFDKFDLRTMQNYSWAFQNDARMICLRDQFSRDAQIAMGQAAERGDFYHLYVNGQYWGLYNTDERAEASYGETYFGGRAEDYDTIKVDPDLGYNIEPTDGNTDAWFRLWQAATNGFASDANYLKVQGLNLDGTPNPAYENLIDVPNLIDYMLVIIYGGNLDAPISNFLSNTSPNNWFGIRNRVGRVGFRFFAHDSEHTLLVENLSVDRTGPFVAGDPAQGSTFLKSSPQYIWSRMYTNAEFRLLVADHIQKYFFNGGPFSTEGARKALLTRSNEIQLAMVAESARWGDAKRAVPFTRNDWVTEMNRIYGQFFSQRPAIVLGQLRNDGLWPTIGAPILSSYGGIVPAGYSLSMTNTNSTGTIYYTLDGSDPRLRGGNIAPSAIAYTPGSIIPITVSTTLKARVRVSATSWSPIIEAQYFIAQDFSKLLLTEIMYNPPGDGSASGNEFEFLEFKNIGAITQDLSGLSFSKGINFAFTNGTRLFPGQFFVIVRNATNFAARYPGVAINGTYTGQLDNGGETLELSHTIAGPVLSIEYDDLAPWPVTPDGFGFSLVPKNPNSNPDPNNARNWRASTNPGGSPGADDPASTIAAILINEALTRTDASPSDAIELFNPTGATVDISGWYLTDDPGQPRKFRIPDGTSISAGGYAVFTEAQFNANPLGTNSFALSSFGDEVYVFSGDILGNLTGYSHGFKYGDAEDGVTFGRYITSTGDEHFVAQAANTLGAANSLPKVGPIVIRQIMYHPPDLPGGADNNAEEFIELNNITAAAVQLYDPTHPTNTWRFRDAVDFNFPTNVTVPPGSSILVVSFDPANAAARSTFLNKYGLFTNTPLFGPFTGQLDNSHDNVELYKVDVPTTNGIPRILVDRVGYRDTAPWPTGPDGTGLALKRISLTGYGNDPTNWTSFAQLQIQVHPQSFFVRPGTNLVVFTVTAIGSGTLSYQWQKNGTNIAGATGASYSISNVQVSDDAYYTVVVTDESGSASSLPGRLLVLLDPVFILHPRTQTVYAGETVTLSVAVTGTQPFGYRWRKNSVTIPGAGFGEGTATYIITNVQPSHAGVYNCIVTNLALQIPGVPSSNATLTVLIDTDGDLLPDSWESANGLDPLNPDSNGNGIRDDLDDSDGDTMSNYQEWIAGTDPRDPLNYLKIETTGTLPGGGAVLRFIAVSNKTYTIQFCDRLDTPTWNRLTNISAVTVNRTLNITNPAPGAIGRFYRLVTPQAQ
jgi:hypothetical protein